MRVVTKGNCGKAGLMHLRLEQALMGSSSPFTGPDLIGGPACRRVTKVYGFVHPPLYIRRICTTTCMLEPDPLFCSSFLSTSSRYPSNSSFLYPLARSPLPFWGS